MSFRNLAIVMTAALALAGCNKNPLQVTRQICPAVAVPAYTGDVTLFTRAGDMNADAIDMVAAVTNVRGTCVDDGANLTTSVHFDVLARRNDSSAARDVTLPWFTAVVQGGDHLAAKQMGQVTVHFNAGQDRAQASATAQTVVARSATSLPPAIEQRLTRKRKPGDEDAAIDPMSDPKIRSAVHDASFEVLVGFQLNQAQLAYNATK